MNEETQGLSDPDDASEPVALPAEEDAEVSRLLAAAARQAPPGPMPDAVAARLEALVSSLSAERSGSPLAAAAPAAAPTAAAAPAAADRPDDDQSDDQLDDQLDRLTPGHAVPGHAVPGGAADDEVEPQVEDVAVVGQPARRRRWPQLVLAAAAICVAGYGIGAVAARNGLGVPSADESAASGGSDSAADDGGLDGDAEADRGAVDGEGIPAAEAGRLRQDSLRRDIRRLLSSSATADDVTSSSARACRPPGLGPGDTWFLATYAGERVAVVAAPPEDGRVAAAIYGCDGSPLDLVEVPAP